MTSEGRQVIPLFLLEPVWGVCQVEILEVFKPLEFKLCAEYA